MADIKKPNGELSAYGLSCGYVERVENGALRVELYHDSCYHVRAHDNYDGRLFWLSLNNLAIARRIYRRAVKLTLANNGRKLWSLGREFPQYQ